MQTWTPVINNTTCIAYFRVAWLGLVGLGLGYQRVVVNRSQSSWWVVISGVQQGTVLRPLLFLLHINDITGNIQSNIRLFADDCIVYCTTRSQDDSCKLQNDISSLLRWAET